MMRTARRLAAIAPSPTIAADQRARARIAAGERIINLTAGEPDFPTPEAAADAGVAAIRAGVTRYGPTAGLPALRRAVAAAFRREQGLAYGDDEILVSAGGKHALASLFLAVLDPGDEVLSPSPCWVSMAPMAALAGGRLVPVETRAADGFVPDPAALARAITPRTRVIALNSPNNPTGAAYPRDVLEEIVALAVRHDLLIASDEIYRRLVYDGFQPVSPAEISPEGKARTVVVNGASKTYAMTGWRVGWAAGPREVIAAMTTVQGHTLSCLPGITQEAARAALEMPPASVDHMLAAFAARMALVTERLAAIPGIRCVRPRGAFYVFPDVSAYYGDRVRDSAGMQDYLLDHAGVAVVAGQPFGDDRHIRLSFAAADEDLREALGRIEGALRGLAGGT